MKKFIPILVALGLLIPAFHANAQMKIGTVDMDKIFKSYYKTKDAEQQVNEARAAARRELDDRVDAYKKELEDVKKLEDEVKNPALSKEAHDTKSKAYEDRLTTFRVTDRELKEFQQTKDKQLQEQMVGKRNRIVEEITKLVQERVKNDNYDIVFDKSGSSLNGVPFLLYSRDASDFSEDIIKELNKSKPKDSAPPAAEKAPKATGKATPTK